MQHDASQKGTRVGLRGLKAKPELNGELGVVVIVAGDAGLNGRYPITLDSGTSLSIKLEKLEADRVQHGTAVQSDSCHRKLVADYRARFGEDWPEATWPRKTQADSSYDFAREIEISTLFSEIPNEVRHTILLSITTLLF